VIAIEGFKQFWFLFQLVTRFMAFHVDDEKLYDQPRRSRFPSSLDEELTVVIQVIFVLFVFCLLVEDLNPL